MATTDKTKFLAQISTVATQVVDLVKEIQSVDQQYWKLNYGPGNANQITDAEASAIGATAADITAALTAIEALQTALITQSQIAAFFKLAR
jgi:hypothetical protein